MASKYLDYSKVTTELGSGAPTESHYMVTYDNGAPSLLRSTVGEVVTTTTPTYVRWDDLRSPATALNLQGPTGPPTADTDGSLLFAHNSTNQVAIIQQMPHAWLEGSEIRPHVHWSKTTDAAGGVVWEMRYRLVGFGDVASDWSDWIAGTLAGAADSTQKHRVTGFGPIDMEGETLSCILSFQVRRNHAAEADDYGANVRMWEFDTHYQIDSRGSAQEFVK